MAGRSQLYVLVFVTLLGSAFGANASLDCKSVLIKTALTESSSNELRLSLLSIIDRETFEDLRKEGSGGANLSFDALSIGTSSDWAAFNRERTRELQLYDFRYDAQHAYHYAASFLPAANANAFVDCLRETRKGFRALLHEVTTSSVGLVLRWDPPAGVEGDCLAVAGDNADIHPQDSNEWLVRADGELHVALPRNPAKEFRLTLNCHQKRFLDTRPIGYGDSVLVPLPPKVKDPVPYLISREAIATADRSSHTAGWLIDGQMGQGWNSGRHAPAGGWVYLDFGRARRVTRAKLYFDQRPWGPTLVQIVGVRPDGSEMVLMHKTIHVDSHVSFVHEEPFTGINPTPVLTRVKIAQIKNAGSWVAWREIEVFGY